MRLTMNNKLYICNVSKLNDKSLYEQTYKLLSIDRRNRVDKYRFDKDKYLSIGSELLLKYIIKDDYSLSYNEYGKPYLNNKDIYFNISHSGDYVLCAISNNEVGCDIEKHRDIDINVAKRFFNINEYENVLKDNNLFFKYWTLKESFIKNIGKGLRQKLNSFEIVLDNKISIKQNINNNEYYLYSYDDIDDYTYSICLLNDLDVEVYKLDINDIVIKKC